MGTIASSLFIASAIFFSLRVATVTRTRIADLLTREHTVADAAMFMSRVALSRVDIVGALQVEGRAPSAAAKRAFRDANVLRRRELGKIERVVAAEHLTGAAAALRLYGSVDRVIRREIAEPMFAGKLAPSDEIEESIRVLSEVEGNYERSITLDLARREDALDAQIKGTIESAIYLRSLWLLGFGVLALGINLYSARLYRQLADERTVTKILQRAFISSFVPLPNCEIGSAYKSADAHAAVGGDLFDVYRLSNELALILIADVSGKGVDAAVITAFVKFTVRGIALRRRDPAQILSEFNVAFGQTVENPYLFVSMFVGILDTKKGELIYASAGHDSAFLRHGRDVRQLSVTGPVLGVMVEPYDTKSVIFDDGDSLVLATDGLTEARNKQGELLGEDAAMDIIADGPQEPQQLADFIVERIRERCGGRLRDDVAILAIRMHVPDVQVA
ncbi:MAG: serine/threonine-protein phosphatase [Candidatus Eremiobacteraeota bacterium]|nr:serine/threonine-protein phosphatase [Candidatus Eremiobacteraeota bacterium]